jgi:hypothetical protein
VKEDGLKVEITFENSQRYTEIKDRKVIKKDTTN